MLKVDAFQYLDQVTWYMSNLISSYHTGLLRVCEQLIDMQDQSLSSPWSVFGASIWYLCIRLHTETRDRLICWRRCRWRLKKVVAIDCDEQAEWRRPELLIHQIVALIRSRFTKVLGDLQDMFFPADVFPVTIKGYIPLTDTSGRNSSCFSQWGETRLKMHIQVLVVVQLYQEIGVLSITCLVEFIYWYQHQWRCFRISKQ